MTSECRLFVEEADSVQTVEVGLQLRGDPHRALPVQDPLQRAHEAIGGVVRRRYGAVAGTALCAQAHPERDLLRHADLHQRPLDAEGARAATPALVDHAHAVDHLGMLGREELGAVDAARLLVGDGDEGEVAAQRQLVAVVQQEGDELHDAHPLHVERAAAPDVAAAHLAAERIDGPVLALEGHDVGVVEQDQLLAARAVAGQRGDERGAAGRVRRLVELVGDALAIEDRAEELAGAGLVAGRVDGVDADVGGEQLRRFLGQRVPVRRESVVRHAVLLESCSRARSGEGEPTTGRRAHGRARALGSRGRERCRAVRGGWVCGAGDGSRTRDLLLGRQTLYQLSYPRTRPAIERTPPARGQRAGTTASALGSCGD